MEGKVLITICTQLVSSPFDPSSGIMRMLGESRVLITHQTRLVRRKLEPQVDLELHRGQRRTQCGHHPQDELVSRHFSVHLDLRLWLLWGEARLEVSHLDWLVHSCDLISNLRRCREGECGLPKSLGATGNCHAGEWGLDPGPGIEGGQSSTQMRVILQNGLEYCSCLSC